MPEAATDNRRDIVVRTMNVRAQTVDAESRSVEATMATETPVQVFDMRTFEVIDEVLLMSGAAERAQVPMLESHMRGGLDSVLGSIRDIRIEDTGMVGRLFFAEGDERADGAFRKVEQGHITDVSIGYRTDNFVDIPAGKTQSVNGRSFTAGDRTLRVTTAWTVREGSLVPIGADENAKIRELSQGPTPRSKTEHDMNKQLRAYLESIGLRHDADEDAAWEYYNGLEGSQRSRAAGIKSGNIKPKFDEPEPTPEPKEDPAPEPEPKRENVDADKVRAEAVETERKRQAEIRGLPYADEFPEVRDKAIDEGFTPDGTARALLKAHREAQTPPAGGGTGIRGTGDKDVNVQRRALTAAIINSVGIDYKRMPMRGIGTEDAMKLRERAANDGERFSDMSLPDICRLCVELEGKRVSHSRTEMIRAAVSTATFNTVFTDSVNTAMTMGWEDAPDSTRAWTEEGEVNDFKQHTDGTMEKSTGMTKHGRGGTAEDVPWSDRSETYKAHRYTGKFTLDEMDIIDDNFNVLQNIRDEMTMDAAQIRPRLVYALLLSNPTMNEDSVVLFHSDHNNTDTNTFSIDNLAAGIIKMAQQTDGDRNLNLMPRFAIAPQDLWGDVRQALNSTEVRKDVDGSNNTGIFNPVQGTNITPVFDNYIGTAGVVDPDSGNTQTGSATNWYLAAARRTIQVVFRRGTGRRPEVRSYTLEKGQWGVGWDIVLDIGAYVRDFRGLYRGNT